MLLINAIYFNGFWKKQFAEKDTVPLPFKVDTKNSVTAQFMKQTENFYYMESDELDAKIMRLPYRVS